MDFLKIFAVSLALSLDAFVMMTANYTAYKRVKIIYKLLIALLIATLHGLFALVGYSFASFFALNGVYFECIVAGLFLMLCINSLIEKKREVVGGLDVKKCVCQSVITSIDAFVGGITLVATKGTVLYVCSCVLVVTFFMCIFGFMLGRFLYERVESGLKYVSATLYLMLCVSTIIEIL